MMGNTEKKNKMGFLRIIRRLFKSGWQVFYFALALAIIGTIGYIFGYSILYNPLGGNDAAHVLAYSVWIDRFFPRFPFWYPLQGAGISIKAGYPQLFSLTSIIIHRLSSLSLIQAFGLIQFLTLIFSSLGIYLFVWWRLKNQTMALIASFLYFLSPMAYVWIIGAGFFAQTYSFMFVPYALLFFDFYLENFLKETKGLKRRLAFLGSVLFISLAILAHPATGVGVLLILGLYGLFYPLLRKEGKRGENLKRGIKATFSVHFVTLLLILFWWYPMQRYTSLTYRGFNPMPRANLEIMARFNLRGTLGLPIDYEYTNFNIAPAVWGLALLSLIFGWFYDRRAFVLFWLATLAIYLTGSFQVYSLVYPLLHEKSNYFSSRFYVAFTLVLIPILAGFGACFLAKTLLLPGKLIIDRFFKKGLFRSFLFWLGRLLVAVIALAAVGGTIYGLRNIYSEDKTVFHYGPERGGYRLRTGISIYNIWYYSECFPHERHQIGNTCQISEKASIFEQLRWRNWPEFKLNDYPSGAATSIIGEEGIMKKVPQEPFERIDITPNLGEQIKIWPVYSDVSLVNTYNFQSSLIHPMWGYMQGVFYTREEIYQKPVLVNELGKYFGIDYLVLNPGQDPTEKFAAAGWNLFYKGNESSRFQVWQPPDSTGLYSLVTQPKILVIGKLRNGAYEQTFRLANSGVLSYERGFLVEGESELVDAYSLSELKGFDAVFLHGYSYKNKTRAWSLLEQYVKQGGNLFIDNGWQFIDKDWGKGPDREGDYTPAELPEPAPVRTSLWQKLDPTWDSFTLNKDLAAKIDLAKVDPPVYEGKAMSGSIASEKDLRAGAWPILFSHDGGVVIAARNYGQGKVLWSGMNLVGFAYEKSEETLKLARELFDWLLPKKTTVESVNDSKLSINRPWPDRVEFTFKEEVENAGMFFREAYYPGWQATLVNDQKKKLSLYRGGPWFMYVNLDKIASGDKLILEYKQPLLEIISKIISIITAVFLLFYLLGKLDVFLSKLDQRFPVYQKARLKLKSLRKTFIEEDEY